MTTSAPWHASVAPTASTGADADSANAAFARVEDLLEEMDLGGVLLEEHGHVVQLLFLVEFHRLAPREKSCQRENQDAEHAPKRCERRTSFAFPTEYVIQHRTPVSRIAVDYRNQSIDSKTDRV